MIKIHTLPAQGMVVKNDDEKSIPSRGAANRKSKTSLRNTQKKHKNTQ